MKPRRNESWRNATGCLHLHQPPESEHEYWCEYPDRECTCPPVDVQQEADALAWWRSQQ